jgi:hypothetical protein
LVRGIPVDRRLQWLVAIAVVLFAFTSLASEDFRNAIGESWRRVISDPGQVCFDYERKLFKDPYSARLDSYSESSAQAEVVLVKYHAKNSYGAYVPGESQCVVSFGKVDEARTQLQRESSRLDKSIATLTAENACLAKKIELQRAGKDDAAKKMDCGLNNSE